MTSPTLQKIQEKQKAEARRFFFGVALFLAWTVVAFHNPATILLWLFTLFLVFTSDSD